MSTCVGITRSGQRCKYKGKYVVDGCSYCGFHRPDKIISKAASSSSVSQTTVSSSAVAVSRTTVSQTTVSQTTVSSSSVSQTTVSSSASSVSQTTVSSSAVSRTTVSSSAVSPSGTDSKENNEMLFEKDVRSYMNSVRCTGSRSSKIKKVHDVSATFILRWMIRMIQHQIQEVYKPNFTMAKIYLENPVLEYLYKQAIALGYEAPPFRNDRFPPKGILRTVMKEEIEPMLFLMKESDFLIPTVVAILCQQTNLLTEQVMDITDVKFLRRFHVKMYPTYYW